MRDELVDGARRFEEVRGTGRADFEANNLLFRIEAYRRDLERLGIVDGSMDLPVGVLRQLAGGFCGPAGPAGPHFEREGFRVAGALADEFGVMTPGRPCG